MEYDEEKININEDEPSSDLVFDDNYDNESEEIPKEERVLRTQAYDKSVSDLVRMIKDNDIILTPEYQRNYIWDNKKASLLIESILLNIPIPVIYASEEENSAWNIVDGLQRLNSLRRYFNNSFKLTGLEVLTDLNNLKYEDLNHKSKRILNNGIIRIILIFQDSNPEIKYDIFMRLNTGSVRLKEQELRNCLYRGNLNDLLKKMRNNKYLLNILGLKEPHKRMDDVEIILRYLALSENYDVTTGKLSDYKGKIKTFLNLYMNTNKKINENKANALEEKFTNTIEKVYLVFGNKAFRKLNKGEYDTKLNRAIMDFILISFELYKKEDLIVKKEKILGLFEKMLGDSDFNDAITKATSDTKQIQYRISTWIKEMEIIMGE